MKPGVYLLSLLIACIGLAWILTLLHPVDLIESSELSQITVTGYQGERMNSPDDFRENSIKGPQDVDTIAYRLFVTGLVKNRGNYTYEDILQFPSYRKVVTLHCVEGWDVTILWEGIQVRDIIRKAEPDPKANTIIFYAVDGYSTSFPLRYIMDNPILMAYGMNNQTLRKERGFPFQLVAEDKWGYKWIKWISGIEISDDTTYKGFWESRGYSNDGSLNRSFF